MCMQTSLFQWRINLEIMECISLEDVLSIVICTFINKKFGIQEKKIEVQKSIPYEFWIWGAHSLECRTEKKETESSKKISSKPFQRSNLQKKSHSTKWTDFGLMAMKTDGYAEGCTRPNEVVARSEQTLVWWLSRRTTMLRVVLG